MLTDTNKIRGKKKRKQRIALDKRDEDDEAKAIEAAIDEGTAEKLLGCNDLVSSGEPLAGSLLASISAEKQAGTRNERAAKRRRRNDDDGEEKKDVEDVADDSNYDEFSAGMNDEDDDQ